MKGDLFRFAGSVCGALIAAVALAADAGINTAQSSLVATFRQENVPVEAAFHKFSGNVRYDAARPANSSAALDVDVTSFDIGDAAYNAEVSKPAWFDSARFPTATFRSATITPGVPGHFNATGALYIKGKTQTISVSFTALKSGAGTAFDGSFELSRKAFGIGDPNWDDVLDDKVQVHFHLLSIGG